MPKGNSPHDPFCSTGLDWSGQENDPSGFKADGTGSSPKDGWGNDAATGVHFLDKAENKRKDKESKYVVKDDGAVTDRSPLASASRSRKSEAQAYESGFDNPQFWYRGSKKG
jgi:hypothetical protein